MKVYEVHSSLLKKLEVCSLSNLNYQATTLVPICIGTFVLHIFPKTKDYNYISLYNWKLNLSTLPDNDLLICNLELNYERILETKSQEYFDKTHPYKIKEEIFLSILKRVKEYERRYNKKIEVWISDKYDDLYDLFLWNFERRSLNDLKEITSLQLTKKKYSQDNILLERYIHRTKYETACLTYGKEFVDIRLVSELETIKKQGFLQYFDNYLKLFNWLKEQKIFYVLKWSAVWSLLLYLCDVSYIDPLQNNISFSRFLQEGKTADIDIDIPSNKRDYILEHIEEITWQNLIFILNSSSKNFNKIVEHPTWILLENKDIVSDLIPLTSFKRVVDENERESVISDLYDSSTYPILEKLWYLKYDIIRSKILEDFSSTWIDLFKLTREQWFWYWDNDFNKYLKDETLSFFQVSSKHSRTMLSYFTPRSYYDLVKLIGANRPALLKSVDMRYLCSQLALPSYISKDQDINRVLTYSQTWKLIIFQDQVLELLDICLPTIWLKEKVDLIKMRISWEFLEQYKVLFLQEFIRRTWEKEWWEQLWVIITNFGLYWFNKGHSMVYGSILYIELFLKKLNQINS